MIGGNLGNPSTSIQISADQQSAVSNQLVNAGFQMPINTTLAKMPASMPSTAPATGRPCLLTLAVVFAVGYFIGKS